MNGWILLFCATAVMAIATIWVKREMYISQIGLNPSKRKSEIKKDVPVAGAWTVHDRDTLRHFLSSDIGQKLVQRLRATEYALATSNAKDVMHTAHSAGLTVGYGQAITHILSLSQSAGAQAETTNDSGTSGEALPIEREWQETVARMSP